MTIPIYTDSPDLYGRCEHVAGGAETDSVVTVQPTEKSGKAPYGMELCARCAATLCADLDLWSSGEALG